MKKLKVNIEQVKSKKSKGKIRGGVFGFNFLLLPCLALCLCVSAVNVSAQSGGQFAIKQTVVSNGGGVSSGGTFATTTTAGQPAAGVSSSSPPFGVRSGFWQNSLAPTAAGVAISGRVLTTNGQGLRNAFVTLTNSTGVVISARTSSFGYYRFEDVEAGQTYVISVTSKRFAFTPRIIAVTDELTDIDFIAEPQ